VLFHIVQCLLFVFEGGFGFGNVFGSDDVTEFSHALGVAAFVVVPSVNFDHGTVNDLRREGINDAAARVVGVVGGDQGFCFESQNSLERTLEGGCLESRIDFLHGGGCFDLKHTIRKGCYYYIIMSPQHGSSKTKTHPIRQPTINNYKAKRRKINQHTKKNKH